MADSHKVDPESEGQSASLSGEDRRILWEQFVEVHAESQKDFDSSVRTLAAAGIGITVSLATALKNLNGMGEIATGMFLVSLASGVLSHASAQMDMRSRIECLRAQKQDGLEGNRWTLATQVLNVIAGAFLIGGGVFLALYIAGVT
jgi:hypothetical protein